MEGSPGPPSRNDGPVLYIWYLSMSMNIREQIRSIGLRIKKRKLTAKCKGPIVAIHGN